MTSNSFNKGMNLKVLRGRFEEMFKDLINPKYLHIVSTINQVALKTKW